MEYWVEFPMLYSRSLLIVSLLYAVLCLVAQSCPILCNPVDCIAHQGPLFMGFSSQEYWSGLPCPTPGDLPNPGIKPRFCLPHHRHILYCLNHQGRPRRQEWVAYPFSRDSSWPRNETRVLCIACGFFTSWTTREVCLTYSSMYMLIPNSQFIPRLPFPFGNHKFAFE